MLLGEPESSKTALIFHFSCDTFQPQYVPTQGIEFNKKETQAYGQTINMSIWECARSREAGAGRSVYRATDSCVLVYDITEISPTELGRFPFVLVGNKADREGERQVE